MRQRLGFFVCAMTDKKITKLPCPRCRKETTWENNSFRPFCSERCKNMDLAAWADEEYRIAGEEPSADEESNE